MKKQWITCLFVGLFMGLSLVLSAPAHAQHNVLNLNYSTVHPANHRISMVAEEWAKEVEKRTNGAIKITMFHGGTLVPPTQAYDSVVKGVADIAMSVLSYHRGRFPLTEFDSLPLGIKSCVTGGRLYNEYLAKFKPKEFDDVKVMYLHANPPAILCTVKKPVANLEELKGMKVRVTPLATPTAKALGAVPVAMPMNDAYDAFSKGVMDGGFLPTEALEGWKLGEVLKYATESYSMGFMSAFYVVMNKEKWAAISPENQKIIEKLNVEYMDKHDRAWEEINESGKAFFLKQGGKMVPLSKAESDRWAKAVEPVLDDYVKMTKEKGLPGDQVLKFVQDYLKKNQK